MAFFSSILPGEWGSQGDPYGDMLAPQDRQQALKAGLGQFGAALLSQGYTRAPQGPLQGIGEGLQGFQQARDRALRQSMEQKLLKRQIGREDVRDARDNERFGMEKENFGMAKDRFGRDARRDDANFAEQDRVRQAQSKLSAVLARKAAAGVRNPSADPEVVAALAEVDNAKAFGALQQEQPLPPDVERQRTRMATAGQVLSPEAEAQRIRMTEAQQRPRLLTPEEEAQRIRMTEAQQRPRLLTPEEEAQKIRMATASAETKAPTEVQSKAGMYLSRMESAEKLLENMEKQGANGRGTNATIADATGSIPLLAGPANLIRNSNNQQVRQAQLDWAGAKLRFESGATITPAEIEQEAERFFPKAGDSPEVIRQKADARRLSAQAMRQMAGRAAGPQQPAAEEKPVLAKPPGNVEMSKTIGNKTYVKIGGQWYEQ